MSDFLVIASRLPSGGHGEQGPRSGLPFALTLLSTRDVEEFLCEMREPDPYRQEAWPFGLLQVEGDPSCAPSLVSWPRPPREEDCAYEQDDDTGSDAEGDPTTDSDGSVAEPHHGMFAYCNCVVVSTLFCLNPADWDALYDAVASTPTAGLPIDADPEIDREPVREHQHYSVPRLDLESI